jgi:hypothetical protein
MQQVLRAYERLPANPMDRAALYSGLFELAKELDEDETQNLENWLKNGGEFPAPIPKNPPAAAGEEDFDHFGARDEEELDDWPDYRPEDFETGSSDVGDEDNGDEDEMDDESLGDHGGEDRDMDEDDLGEVDLNEDDLIDRDAHRHMWDDADEDFHPRRKRKAAGVSVECLICAETYDVTEFPADTQITSNCHHKNDERVCLYCLQQSIATAVAEGQLHLIICPFCPEKLSHGEVKQYATREVFFRYFLPYSSP